MNEHELDTLFAQARAPTEQDHGAAARFLAGHRARRTHARHVRAGWLSALLASAAVLGGFAALRTPTELPSSAAYQAYESALGDGW